MHSFSIQLTDKLKVQASGHPKPVLCDKLEGQGRVGTEVRGGFRMEGTHVYLWPIYTDVWQKPSQYCKVIFLQLK